MLLFKWSAHIVWQDVFHFSERPVEKGSPMQFRHLTIFVILAASSGFYCSDPGSLNGAPVLPDSELYGKTAPVDYLSGRFNPASHEKFVSLQKAGVPERGYPKYLRKEAAEDFKKLIAAFKKDHPNIQLYITSATRPFISQKGIWEAKFNGSRKVGGKDLSKTIPDHKERSRKILQYSSMPSTSRHHWGTDLDINSLNPAYYTYGEGKIIYDWFEKNAAKYGFCQPYKNYEERKGGYFDEPWHWTYTPLAKQLLSDWNRYYDEGKINASFAGSKAAYNLAPEYVNTINPDCK